MSDREPENVCEHWIPLGEVAAELVKLAKQLREAEKAKE